MIKFLTRVVRVELLQRAIRTLKYKVSSIRYLKLNNKGNFILVYTMGKVASSSIYETLKSKLAYTDLYHVHFLTEKNLKWRESFKRNKYATLIERYVLKKLKVKNNKKLKIISVVRDITARDLSMVFQNIDSFMPNFNNKTKIDSIQIEEILNNQNQNLSLNWFENEFEVFLGIDIYSFPFDREKGFSIYRLNNVDILIIKLEKLNECYKDALFGILGVEFNNLIKVNDTANKGIAKIYNGIKNDVRIGKKRLNNNYNSKYMKHFYTEKEIEKFNNKWKSK